MLNESLEIIIINNGKTSDWSCPKCKKFSKSYKSWRSGDRLRCIYCDNQFNLKGIKLSSIIYDASTVEDGQ